MNNSLIESDEFYDNIFHRATYGVGGEWPHVTILFYKVQAKSDAGLPLPLDPLSSQWIKIQNNAGDDHAEVIFDTQITEALYQNAALQEVPNASIIKHLVIDVVLSYSPCKNCADLLIALKQRIQENYGINCTLKIKVANFYKHYIQDHIKKMIEMLGQDIQISIFDGLYDWKDFLDNTVRLPLEFQSEKFGENWSVRREREAVDSAILACMKLAALSWNNWNGERKGSVLNRIRSITTVASAGFLLQ